MFSNPFLHRIIFKLSIICHRLNIAKYAFSMSLSFTSNEVCKMDMISTQIGIDKLINNTV